MEDQNNILGKMSLIQHIHPTYPPRLLYDDLNGDENEELIIILTLGYGTGALEEEVHIIDPESLKETRVENALQIIDDHVELEVTPENIEVKVSGRKQIIPKTEWETESEKIHSAGFGSIVSYKVENDVLKAYVVGTLTRKKV